VRRHAFGDGGGGHLISDALNAAVASLCYAPVLRRSIIIIIIIISIIIISNSSSVTSMHSSSKQQAAKQHSSAASSRGVDNTSDFHRTQIEKMYRMSVVNASIGGLWV